MYKRSSQGYFRPRILMFTVAVLFSTATSTISIANAADTTRQSQLQALNIPAQPLSSALTTLSKQTGTQVYADGALVEGRSAPAINGNLTAKEALNRLLEGSGLKAVPDAKNNFTIQKQANEPSQLPEVAVNAAKEALPSDLPKPYAGGQVARGGRTGIFGNRDLFDVPFSITSYTRDQIDNQQARTMVQILGNDPSITIAQNANSAGADDVYNIRGFLAASSNATFDGITGIGGRSQALEGIERVEILKGPSAFLNGAPGLTVGGNINFVPKRAGVDPLTRLTTRYYSDSVFGIHGDVGRRFGENKEFGIRVNGAFNDGNTALDLNKKRNEVATIALDYQGEKVRLWADYEYSYIYSRGFLGGTTISPGVAIPSAPENSNNWGQPWSTYPQDKRRGLVKGEWDFAENWTASLAYGEFKQTDGPYPTCRSNIANSNGALSINCSSGGGKLENYSVEASVRGHFSTGALNHRLALGTTHTNSQNYSSLNNFAAVTLPGNIGSSIYNPIYYAKPAFTDTIYAGKTSETDIRTMFIGDEIGIFDNRLLVTLGLRHVQFNAGNYNATTGIRTGKKYDTSKVTPAAGVVFKLQPGISLYGNYAEALEQSGVAPIGTSNAGQVLEPLESKQYEAGAKFDFGRLATTIAAFEITKANTLTVNNVFGVNGQQINRGLELSVFGELVDHVRVLSGISWITAKQSKTAGGTFDGNDAVGVPRRQARVGLEFDVLPIRGLVLTGGAAYNDSAFVDASNDREIPSWTRFDLGGRYAFSIRNYPTVARLNIENVTDRDYWASVDRGSLYSAQPRTVSLSLTTDF